MTEKQKWPTVASHKLGSLGPGNCTAGPVFTQKSLWDWGAADVQTSYLTAGSGMPVFSGYNPVNAVKSVGRRLKAKQAAQRIKEVFFKLLLYCCW